ncbi:MAG: serine/threonine-protein kinase [Steroidobacteraceae bacterium]
MTVPHARWREVRALFEQVVEAGPSHRAETLERIGRSDPELKASVEALLSMDEVGDVPLQSAIGAAAGDLLEQHADRLIGTRVGPYRITSVLGHGGTSTVYAAERSDPQFQQVVAIKVLHHATLHPRMRNRLHSERHILAKLEHPCIARLIDSGDLEDGTPYIVMEHVAGEDVLQYCDSRTLFVRERLELFVKICEAVQYAHRNLIVHRDLKPGNILVNREGSPKLLDFGIAKLLAPESISHTLPVTRLQERVLTPENAAPEQVLGRPITTATDIYALGVLLYQLLSGRPPYRLASYSQLQLERAICMDDPVRASQAVTAKLTGESELDRQRISDRRGLSPERLRARLSGDLDAIIAMAMRKEPDRRYASAQALAEDITRHLGAEPVIARQGDWRYNSAKFLRRHFLGVSIVAGLVIGMAAVAGVTLWQNHRIEMAREATARERDRAQQVSSFLVDVFSQADPFNAQGHEVTARELLDRGAARILENLDEQPEVRAELLESIGLAYRRQGLAMRAVPLFEQALAIRRNANPPNPSQVAAALANLAQALADTGNLTSAEGYLNQALALSRQPGLTATRQTADILMQLGTISLDGRSKPEQATEYFQQALSLYRNVLGIERPEVASALAGLATTAQWRDDLAGAEKYQRDALEIVQATLSRDHPDYAIALANLGNILIQRSKYAEAEPMLNEALEVERRVFGPTHQRVAQTLENLANLYELTRGVPAQHRHHERGPGTDPAAPRAPALHRRLSPRLSGQPVPEGGRSLRRRVASARGAGHLREQPSARTPVRGIHAPAPGRHPDRPRAVRRGRHRTAQRVDLSRRLAGNESWRADRAEASLGWSMIRSGDEQTGTPLLLDSQARLLRALGPRNPAVQQATRYLAEYYRLHHRDADAARVLAVLNSR